ncbi:MAG: tol-pal system protein YbgF [Gammaproteobacteria bacterium]|nr:tol-pal system protein YbgF [Gammaproteobacteria bacterium]
MWADGRKPWAFTLLIAVQGGGGVVSAQEVADTGITIAERLERIESALSNQGLLEMVQQIQSLEVEINRLSGEMEVQNHVLEQLKKRQRDLYTDIDRRLQRLENPLTAATGELAGEDEPPLQTLSPFEGTEVTAGQQAETPLTLELVDQVGQEPAPGSAGEDVVPLTVPPGQPTEPLTAPEVAGQQFDGDGLKSVPGAEPVFDPGVVGEAVTAVQETELSETPGQEPAASGTSGEVVAEAPAAVDPVLIEAAYRHAFDLLKQSLYDPAIQAFREFLMRYPGTEYAGNAQFWLAEAYYVNSRFGQALVEYSTLVQRYPESPKLAQATLKAAFCQHELGQVEAARRQLDEIIQQYPGTTAASLAQDRLAQIAAETAAATTTPAN